jgi:Uma2 family endonuclease
MATATGLTIEEFEQLPDALAHNHELVNGELVDVSGKIFGHNRLRDVLARLMGSYVDEQRLGFVISEQEFQFEDNAHGPDVSFFGPEKVKLAEGGRRVRLFVPDLAIEIASQGERFETLLEKVHRYRRCGTKEVYLFSMAIRQVFVFSEQRTAILGENDEFRPEQIPGFAIRIADLFSSVTLLP